jgi:N-acyl-D-aspartate/D-glutamate deacylase
MALDLLIKNGTVVDGSGMPRYRADVGVSAGKIVEIGRIRAPAEQVIDADGLIVAPGFIDGHTHMDAQIAWDSLGSCSCWHGVTSVVMGNCGFALAPCKPADREWFARCLTAVEDIPTEAMLAGIDWNWESFPEYLTNVERLPKGLNYGMYIGHSALRMYVMGRRGLEQPATEDDLLAMEAAVAEAVRAGALGFSTSRATTHITPDGTPVASRIAEWEEIDRLVGAMAALDAGIFQIGPRHFRWRRAARFLRTTAPRRLANRPADHVRHTGDKAGVSIPTRGIIDALYRRDGRDGRPHVWPGDDALDQCRLLAQIVSAV